ncbi:MAG TPA: hypothetical protein VGK09_08270 [Rhodocyclaceae bacterium]|jgi:DNA-directed RNA polymerase subunit RPC12/RpoP
MALINCKECNAQVSTEAKSCPHCGAKVSFKKPVSLLVKLFLIALGIGIVGATIDSNRVKEAREQAEAAKSPQQKVKEESDRKKHEVLIQWGIAGAMQLKNGMKDPATFELTSLYLTPTDFACYEYRAKNSFGAILPSSAVLTPKGKLLLRERDNGAFATNWNKECTKPGGEEIKTIAARTGLL